MMRRHADVSDRGGFTLIEILVAIAIAGVVIVTAYQVVSIVVDTIHHVATQTSEMGRRRNDERTLSDLLDRLSVGPDTTEAFVGMRDSAHFMSACVVGGGWLEPCTVSLRLVSTDDSVRLEVDAGSWHNGTLVRKGQGQLSYLRTAGGDGDWVSRWQSALTAPLALRITVGDSVWLLRTGDRG